MKIVTGGLMKLRFLAVVLVTIAIATPEVAKATDGSFTLPSMTIKAKEEATTFDMRAAMLAGFGGSSNGSNGNTVNMWKCAVEEHDAWDKANDTLSTVVDGLLSWKALANSYQRTKLEYGYLNNVANLNNTWRMMDSALKYSTQQQVAYYQYRYGSNYGSNNNYSGRYNYNQGIGNYAKDIYNGYSDNYYGNWI